MLQRSPRLIILEETDPEALKALLSALHFRLLQSPPSLGTCIKVISLTEKHDCKAALAPWIARWAQPSTDGLDDLSKLEIGQLAYVLYYSRAPQFPGFCTEVVRYLDPDFASEWAEDEVVTRGFEADGMIEIYDRDAKKLRIYLRNAMDQAEQDLRKDTRCFPTSRVL